MRGLVGKVALVSGAASGIGRETAILLAEEKAKVILVDIDNNNGDFVKKIITEKGGEAFFYKADVSRISDVRGMVETAISKYGRLDIAINNAGIEGQYAFISECDVENFNKVIDVNLKGAWLAVKYEILEMLKSGSGAIVNLSSVWGLRASPGAAPYVISKHGIIGLTKAAAVEYSGQGIRINCVCPGGIDTPMLDRIFRDHGFNWEDALPQYPIGRKCSPKEVAEVIVWLCSEGASFVSGSCVTVDGGHTVLG